MQMVLPIATLPMSVLMILPTKLHLFVAADSSILTLMEMARSIA
jgi:hypothetical protein